MPALTPPRFVNLPSDAVYGDLPAPLFLSLARLRGLAWNQPDKTTLPPLTLGELSVVLGCRERQTWEHLHALRRAGWLAWVQNDGVLYIHLTQPTLQSFASSGDQGDDDDERPFRFIIIITNSGVAKFCNECGGAGGIWGGEH